MSTLAKILISIAAALLAIAAILWVFHNIFFPNWTPSWEQTSTSTTTNTPTNTTNTSGNWSLNMKSDATITGIESSIHSMGVGNVNFAMPTAGQKVTAVMPYTSEGTGTVGQSSETANLEGTINITAEIKNNKLHLVYTYLFTKCVATVSTPVGGIVNNECPIVPESHTTDIEIADGKTATVHSDESVSGSTSTWLETWTLNKAR